MIPIEKPIIDKIMATLESVEAVKQIFAYPLLEGESITQYPAVVFYPDSYDIEYGSVADNFEIRRFKLYIIVQSNQTNGNTLFTDILPNVVDKVISAFGADWDGGTFNGHRMWLLLSGGKRFIFQTESGLEAGVDFTLDVKLSTTN